MGTRFNLGEPWDGNLADFCAAHFTGSATDVVRAALDMFIPADLAMNKGSAEKYEKLQRQRQESETKPAD